MSTGEQILLAVGVTAIAAFVLGVVVGMVVR